MEKINSKAIIHDDYDGLISYLIYKKFVDKNVELEGFYKNCCTLITKNGFDFDNIEKYIGIDIDIEVIKSLGHHLQYQNLVNKELCLNPNIKFGNDGAKDITKKCPFSTALLLVLTYPEVEEWFRLALMRKDYKTVALVLYADNFYPYIWQRFLPNVSQWLKKYDKYQIFLDIIHLPKTAREAIEEEMKKIETSLNDCFTTNKQGKYSQKFSSTKLQEAFNILKTYLEVEGDEELDLRNSLKFKYFEEEITNELISALEEEKGKGNLVSHAVTSGKTINYTLKK